MDWNLEMNIETIVAIVTLLLGGGGIGSLLTWRHGRAKAKAEAEQAKAEAERAKGEARVAEMNTLKEVQGIYGQMTVDMKATMDALMESNKQKDIAIEELKNALRTSRQENVENQRRVRELENRVARMGALQEQHDREIAEMRIKVCHRGPCPYRITNPDADGKAAAPPKAPNDNATPKRKKS